jgi:hypothetical protein
MAQITLSSEAPGCIAPFLNPDSYRWRDSRQVFSLGLKQRLLTCDGPGQKLGPFKFSYLCER